MVKKHLFFFSTDKVVSMTKMLVLTSSAPEHLAAKWRATFCDSALRRFNWQLHGRATWLPNKIDVLFFPTNRAFFWWYLITSAVFIFCAINKNRATIFLKNSIFFTFCYNKYPPKIYKKNVFLSLGRYVFFYIFLVKKKIAISVYRLVCAKFIAFTK